MKNKQKAITASILLIILGLIPSLTTNVIAENVYLTEEEIQRIGDDNNRLESPIGVIMLNLSKNELTADGYLSLSNTYDNEFILQCKVVTKLSTVDLDETGQPRIHPKISNRIVFHPIPDKNWIKLTEETATIEPDSIYNFYFTLDVPEEYVLDENNGYLVYIKVGKDTESIPGANIGIDYNYKLFIIFTGELVTATAYHDYMLFPIMMILAFFLVILIILLFIKRKEKKETTEPTKYDLNTYNEKKPDEKTIHTDVDFILQNHDKIRGSKY